MRRELGAGGLQQQESQSLACDKKKKRRYTVILRKSERIFTRLNGRMLKKKKKSATSAENAWHRLRCIKLNGEENCLTDKSLHMTLDVIGTLQVRRG